MAEADEERVEDIILRADKNKKKLTEYTSAEWSVLYIIA